MNDNPLLEREFKNTDYYYDSHDLSQAKTMIQLLGVLDVFLYLIIIAFLSLYLFLCLSLSPSLSH